MDSQKFKIIIIVTLAAFAALYLGVSAATEQFVTIAWVLGGLSLIGLLALGGKVWTLLPVFSVLAGQIAFLPGYPSPWYAVTPVVAMMLGIRFMMRSKQLSYQFCWMDAMMVLQVLVLLQAYLRNPVSLSILGGSSTTVIGGRPYVDYMVAIFAYFMLASIKTDPKTVQRVILCMAIVMIMDAGLKAATMFSGGLAGTVGRIYTNFHYEAAAGGQNYAIDLGTTRLTSLSSLSTALGLVLFSFFRPIACLNPLRPVRFFSTILMVFTTLMSGFRSELIKVVCYFIAGSWIRKRLFDVVAGGAALLLLGCLVLGIVGARALPYGVQRTISFLPVEVDPDIRASAEGSSDWRFEMWRLVLTSDRYISNKMLGDGFGYTMAEHQAQVSEELGLLRGTSRGDSIDAFIAKGSYHGWHVEAIRFTGVAGLLVGILILLALARYAFVLVRHYSGSPFFPYAAFICIPFIIEPFFTLFVFGSYKGSFITYIARAGMLRMLYNLYRQATSQSQAASVENVTDKAGTRGVQIAPAAAVTG